MSEFVDTYAFALMERYRKIDKVIIDRQRDSSGNHRDPVTVSVLQVKWRGLHTTRCELLTLRNHGVDIWYSAAKSLDEVHDDLNDPKSIERLDRMIDSLIMSALVTENEILSSRGQTGGTTTRPSRPYSNRRDLTPTQV